MDTSFLLLFSWVKKTTQGIKEQQLSEGGLIEYDFLKDSTACSMLEYAI